MLILFLKFYKRWVSYFFELFTIGEPADVSDFQMKIFICLGLGSMLQKSWTSSFKSWFLQITFRFGN